MEKKFILKNKKLIMSNSAVQFMIESLKKLNTDLRKKESNLHLFHGDYLKVLEELIKKYKVDNIYTNTDYTPYAVERDQKIEKLCQKLKVEFHAHHDNCLFTPGSILTGSETVYQKFTPFYNECLKQKFPSTQKLKNKRALSNFRDNKYQISFDDTKKFYQSNENLHVKGGRKLAKKLIDDGVPVFHKEAQSLIHGFIRCRDQSPLGNKIFKEMINLLKSFH